VKNAGLRHYSTSPVWMKILSFLTAATTLFYAFHLFMDFVLKDQFEAAMWVREVHFYIACFFPGFLLLTSTIGENKVRARVMWAAAGLYAVCIALNIPNSHEVIEIYHLQYPTSIALLIMLTVAIIHFVKKKKNMTDVIKLAWLFSFTYMYVVPRFVPTKHQAGWFVIAMQVIYPIMMTIGLIQYYRKPKNSAYAP
jgi:hypothetical protein